MDKISMILHLLEWEGGDKQKGEYKFNNEKNSAVYLGRSEQMVLYGSSSVITIVPTKHLITPTIPVRWPLIAVIIDPTFREYPLDYNYQPEVRAAWTEDLFQELQLLYFF